MSTTSTLSEDMTFVDSTDTTNLGDAPHGAVLIRLSDADHIEIERPNDTSAVMVLTRAIETLEAVRHELRCGFSCRDLHDN
ncbi:hypothetical protein [Knoellia koreensis]|uniref:Uncharacterized protein n=1 Tax=Knoellia koreensis TaxID=2730921 RepID=A0A849HFX5_9MICO|nr:hypothetical protein [Knoellia sp. DB2414S]NNM45141.1 hypothetical protein [Knoellia sp. DB2414S]